MVHKQLGEESEGEGGASVGEDVWRMGLYSKPLRLPIFLSPLPYILSSNNLSNHSAETAAARLQTASGSHQRARHYTAGGERSLCKQEGTPAYQGENPSNIPPLFRHNRWFSFLLHDTSYLLGAFIRCILATTDQKWLVFLLWAREGFRPADSCRSS